MDDNNNCASAARPPPGLPTLRATQTPTAAAPASSCVFTSPTSTNLPLPLCADGKHSMGSADWAPSSKVLAPPGGSSSINLYGGYSDSPAKQQRRAGGARIIGGKVVLPDGEKEANAAAYTAAQARPTSARPQFGEPPQQQQQQQMQQPAASAEPEMRGCEGYKPNYGAFANGGLTSSSTELGGPQAVGRSSTRLHAPPGGASSICFG